MRPPDIGGIDHEVPQALVLAAPVMLRPHDLHHHTVLLVVVPQKGVPLEVKNSSRVLVPELLREMQQEELQGDVVGVLERVGHRGCDVLLDERGLQSDVYVVLEAVYLHLFGEEDQLDRVDAHPGHVRVQVFQLFKLVLVAVQDVSNNTVEVGPDRVLQTLKDYFWFLMLVGPAAQDEVLASNAFNSVLDSFLVCEPALDAIKHAEDGVFCSDAHEHFEQLVVLQEVEPLELDPFLLEEMGEGLGDGIELLDVVVEHEFGVFVEVFGGLDEPLDVLHGLVDDGHELLGLGGQLLLGVLAGEDGEEAEELLLVGDGQLEQSGEAVDAPEVVVALPAGEGAVLVVDDVEQDGRVLLDLLAQLVVVVEDDDQRVLVQVLPLQLDALPPVVVLLQQPLDLLLLVRLEVYLQHLLAQLREPVLVDYRESEVFGGPAHLPLSLEELGELVVVDGAQDGVVEVLDEVEGVEQQGNLLEQMLSEFVVVWILVVPLALPHIRLVLLNQRQHLNLHDIDIKVGLLLHLVLLVDLPNFLQGL